ncbi:hypothetical protein ACA910_005987 [Epithemia clementina (nom. ined.)]
MQVSSETPSMGIDTTPDDGVVAGKGKKQEPSSATKEKRPSIVPNQDDAAPNNTESMVIRVAKASVAVTPDTGEQHGDGTSTASPPKIGHSSSWDGDRYVQVPDDSSVVSELETPEFSRNKYSRKKSSAAKGTRKSPGGKGENRNNNNLRRSAAGRGLGPKSSSGRDSGSLSQTPRKGVASGDKETPQSTKLKNKARSTTDLVAAQNLAKARIRAMKLKEQKENEKLSKQQQARSDSEKRPTRFTAEEGHARARARVKLRKLKEKALAMEGINNGSRPPSLSPNRALRGNRHQDDLVSILSTLSMDPEACRSYLLADDNQTAASRASSKRPLTVPKGPKFALDAKYGDKAAMKRQTMLSADDDVSDHNTVSSVSTWGTERSLTVPHGPKFLLDAKYGDKGKRAAKPNSNSGATTTFSRGTGNDGEGGGIKQQAKAAISHNAQPNTTTQSTPTKAQMTHRRYHPKSSLEVEEQELKKQFKARPMPKFSTRTTRSVAPTRRETNEAVPSPTSSPATPQKKVTRKPGANKSGRKPKEPVTPGKKDLSYSTHSRTGKPATTNGKADISSSTHSRTERRGNRKAHAAAAAASSSSTHSRTGKLGKMNSSSSVHSRTEMRHHHEKVNALPVVDDDTTEARDPSTSSDKVERATSPTSGKIETRAVTSAHVETPSGHNSMDRGGHAII